MALLDDEWLAKAIAQNKVQIQHEKLGEGVLLTTPTAELQKFALKYVEDEKAFAVEIKLSRRK